MNAKVSRSILAGVCVGSLAVPTNAQWCTDVDGNGSVDIFDFLAVAGAFDESGPEDINMDGQVDCADLALVGEYFGPCPSPAPGSANLFDQLVVVDATTLEAESFGFLVTHIYATGASVVIGDQLLAVDAQSLTATTGTLFFQETTFGGLVPPNSSLFSFVPELPYDTFVTMTSLADGMINTCLSIESTTSISGLWFPAQGHLSSERMAQDIGDATGAPGQAGVLIAQITMLVGNTENVGYDGTLRLYTSPFDMGSLAGVAVSVSFIGSVPNVGDLDADGVPDSTDNCPEDVNPEQEDLDDDGLGDVCDLDDDNDGVDDTVDNCPIEFNPDQLDTDFDGLGDACDMDFGTDTVLAAIQETVADAIQQITSANPPGVNGLIAKLNGNGGVVRKLADAVAAFEAGSIDTATYIDQLNDALDKLTAFDNQLAAKIFNGQIVNPEASALLQHSGDIRDSINAMIASAP